MSKNKKMSKRKCVEIKKKQVNLLKIVFNKRLNIKFKKNPLFKIINMIKNRKLSDK